MPRPTLKFLSEDTVAQIIQEGIGVLNEPGVRVHNHTALALLAEAGASVDFSEQVARIPESLIHQSLESAPQEFYLYNLEGQAVVHYGGDDIHFDPGSAAVTILDVQTGQQCSPTTADLVRFVKLVEALPQFDAQSTAFVCRDVPEGIGDLYRLYIALSYMHKPIITGAFGKDTWWVMWELLCTAAGGEAALVERPLAVFDVCPSPPLLWSDLTCQNLMDCASKSIPAQLISMPLAGATAPVTLAGSVVQHCAESLSGLVIHQLTRPGAPIVWGGAPATFDMRSGTTPMGDVGTWMIDCAYVEVGKALGLPTHTYMGSTDAKTLDVQSGIETAGGTLLAALAGVNMISGAGMIDFLRCQSFEKLVLDAEVIGMAKRLAQGIELRDQPIALDVMRKAGHKAGYLANSHTQRWFRKELHMPSEVMDRGSLEAWQKKGSKTSTQRAAERMEQALAAYPPSSLSREIRLELRRITQLAAMSFGMEDLPSLPDEF
jgi:trimethylamine---corrinoid protein Co-methyltransferase